MGGVVSDEDEDGGKEERGAWGVRVEADGAAGVLARGADMADVKVGLGHGDEARKLVVVVRNGGARGTAGHRRRVLGGCGCRGRRRPPPSSPASPLHRLAADAVSPAILESLPSPTPHPPPPPLQRPLPPSTSPSSPGGRTRPPAALLRVSHEHGEKREGGGGGGEGDDVAA